MNVNVSSRVDAESTPSASRAPAAATVLSRIASTVATISGSLGFTAAGFTAAGCERQAAAVTSAARIHERLELQRNNMENSCRCLVSSIVSGAGARIDTAAPAAGSTDLLDVVETTGPITQREFELRRLQRALHQLEQTREPIRPHLLAQSLLARPVLNVRDAHRIARFARQHQLTTHAAPFTPRGHHQRAKGIDQTPRLAACRGDRQRQSDHACRRADCVPHRVVKWLATEAVRI